MRNKLNLLAVGVLAAVVVAGCGSSNDTSSTTTAATPSTPAPTGSAAVVSTASTPKLGTVLVGADGKTLYLFKKDKGGKSACYNQCATVWPPVISTGKPTAEKGAKASLLGTTKRKDGTVQVTYAGFPLYGYIKDTRPGSTLGNDFTEFGAQWYALTPSGGEPKEKKGGASSSSSTSSGGSSSSGGTSSGGSSGGSGGGTGSSSGSGGSGGIGY